MSEPKTGAAVPDTYFQLVHRFPPVPIRGEEHCALAAEILNELTARDLDEGEEAYLDVLTDLVETWEAEHLPEADPPGGEVLKELISQSGLTQEELADRAGVPRDVVSALVAGERPFTHDQARKLGAYFKLEPAAFLPL